MGPPPGRSAGRMVARQEDVMLQRLPAPACVWMQAGIIRFWLCDRDFDCENCPLDTALRAPRPVPREPVPLGGEPVDPTEIPDGPSSDRR